MSPPSSASASSSASPASCTAPAPATSPSPPSPPACSALAARLLHPASKLATARSLAPDSDSSSLGSLLALGPVSGNALLAMLDWLRQRQPWIQRSLARRQLQDGTLLLYDVTSAYLEGHSCPLAAFGSNRDGKQGKRQIVCGLLCAADGCPVAVEVFAGNTADPTTVSTQVRTIRERFGIARIALAGERGMRTTARLREDLEPAGLDWISALKTQDIRPLLKRPKPPPGADPAALKAPLRPGELVPEQVAEIRSPDCPGERLLVCLHPRLRAARARKREELLQATERILEKIAALLQQGRKPLRGRHAIHRRVGREANRKKMEKHFAIEVSDDALSWARKQERIEAEARLDGIYIVRTSLPADALGAEAAVAAYKSLARVERAFRSLHRRPSCRCGRCMCMRKSTCGGTCSCACWPTTWNGTCAASWHRCCSRMPSARRPRRDATRRWSRRGFRARPRPRQTPSGLRTGYRCRACGPCWSIWDR